jgi:hypothetical protein
MATHTADTSTREAAAAWDSATLHVKNEEDRAAGREGHIGAGIQSGDKVFA